MDFALKATRYLAERANLQTVKIPVVIVSAAEDKLVTDIAQRRAAANLPDGHFISVAGAEHEILMETDDKRDQFWVAFDALADRLAPPLAEPVTTAEVTPIPASEAPLKIVASPEAQTTEAATKPGRKPVAKPSAAKTPSKKLP